MAAVKDIYKFIDDMAPFATQEGFDNAGLLVGRTSAPVDTVLVTLDITKNAILEAEQMEAQLIISHHPIIFDPLKSVTDKDITGEKVLMLAERGIAAICAHTNLDAAEDGVNDHLARAVGLEQIRLLERSGTDEQGRHYGIGRIGVYGGGSSVKLIDFANIVKNALQAVCVRYVDAGVPVRNVAVGGGSCGSMLQRAVQAGCDTFVTADIKYDVFLAAAELGINLLDAGHFATEDVVCQPLADRIAQAFPGVNVRKSEAHREVFFAV